MLLNDYNMESVKQTKDTRIFEYPNRTIGTSDIQVFELFECLAALLGTLIYAFAQYTVCQYVKWVS